MAERSTENDGKSSNIKKAFNASVGFIKGSKVFNWVKGKDLTIKFKSDARIDVFDNSLNSKLAILRFDRPHPKLPTEHINIASKITGNPDPHIKLPAGGLAVNFNNF